MSGRTANSKRGASGAGELAVVVLAAGEGKRMRSSLPKVLHEAAGRPLVEHVLLAAAPLGAARTVVVVGHGAARVEEALTRAFPGGTREGAPLEFVVQEPGTGYGTGFALKRAAQTLTGFGGRVLVLNGDGPLLRTETLKRLEAALGGESGMALLSCRVNDPSGLGRVARSEGGEFVAIVEEKDATSEERATSEINVGVYLFDPTVLNRVNGLKPSAATGEYYITDLPSHYLRDGERVLVHEARDETEVLGVNDRAQLALVEGVLRNRIRERWLRAGVTMLHPASCFIDDTVSLERDVVLEQGVTLRGKTRVGEGSRIGAYSVIEDRELPAGTRLPPHTLLLA